MHLCWPPLISSRIIHACINNIQIYTWRGHNIHTETKGIYIQRRHIYGKTHIVAIYTRRNIHIEKIYIWKEHIHGKNIHTNGYR